MEDPLVRLLISFRSINKHSRCMAILVSGWSKRWATQARPTEPLVFYTHSIWMQDCSWEIINDHGGRSRVIYFWMICVGVERHVYLQTCFSELALKYPTKHVGLTQSILHTSSPSHKKCNMFSPWYSWKIAYLTLKQQSFVCCYFKYF